jgi:hypothetical protein
MYKLIIIVSIFILGLYFVYSYPSTMEGFELGIGRSRCPNILIQKGAVFYLYNSKLAKIPGVNPLQFNSLDDYVEFMDWQRSQGIRCPILYLQESYDAQGNPVLKARPSPTDLQGGLQPLIGDVGTIAGTNLVGQEPTNVGPNDIVSANKNMRIASRQEYKDAFGVQPLPAYELPIETKLIDAGRDDKPYNTNSYPSYDPLGLYNGLETPLDKLFHSPDGVPSANPMDTLWLGQKYTQEMIDSGKISSTRVNDPYE